MLRFAILLSLALVAVGCEQRPTIVTVPAPNKEADIHIKGPRGNIDIEKNRGGNVDIEVKRKDP